jgi:hypothetical protein
MRERVDLKSPVRENCTPGSVRGAPGNRCPYLDRERRKQKINCFLSVFRSSRNKRRYME